jgi:ATP-binding cassette subfamily G (WHITE) protein 2 (SNQ2)
MYRPSAIALANTFADLPFSAARVLIFNIPVYFMTNLNRSAGGFWTFHLFNYIAYLTMQGTQCFNTDGSRNSDLFLCAGFFRTFGLICTNFDVAFRLAVFFIPNLCVPV